jgi:hypothetical protein
MRKRLLSILALTILVMSTLVGCGGASSIHSTLTILSITEGDVFVMKAGTEDWIEAEVEMSLEVGDRIKTGDDSGAEITFFDGSTMELEAGTEIEITSLDISADTGVTTIILMQTIGTTISRVIKLVDPASRYEIETPTGVVAVRGSMVEVRVAFNDVNYEDGTTWATNLEGDIWAVAQGVELQIPELRQCIIRHNQPPKLTWDLAVSSTTGGSVTNPGEGTYAYEEGAVVDLVAEAEDGYVFVNWTGDVATIANVNAASTTVAMDAACSITANFVRGYSLIIYSWGGGWVSWPGEGTFTYAEGRVVNLVATPVTGYQFIGWTGDVGTISDVYAPRTTIVINSNYSITANFEREPYIPIPY